ncbi:hypothetical protein RO3G_05754 [Rhizopus delemar RA 99-880]|uniref:Gelsolin-like domain-containing protein n=1 Tax=Rhizopus delemar (strain RA 99-880 / ATCC MYA-4621 / FGSC 9543 / NRRL 43880) TaxID=246409 RepID=I1BXW9_RHIO9|nr:hypothetical protein RO3G_05754 [Rhizopus delemar RA 99-880]|eukprot:EIE81049.1 hypothetical protein RO3G_05754 [Rhizopus delemar RA 99-880]
MIVLDDTNLANFGSELEREHRKEEGALETAWNYEGSPIGHETGLWIWRVQNFKLIAVPRNQYGKFYQGDSYVVLSSVKKENSDGLIHHIHFWLVLDTYGSQHREVQKKESSLFLSYFKQLTYLQGGFASGFNHVEEEQEPPTRLLRVQRPKRLEGSRRQNAVVISECPLSYTSLRSAEQDSGDHQREFFEALGSEGEVEEGEEEEEEEEEEFEKRLLRLSSSGLFGMKLKMELIGTEKIRKEMFESDHVFIFDVGHQVYTWIGKHASRKERKHGLRYAQDYVKSTGRSSFTPICQIIEGGEDELFEANLEGWQGW